MRKEHPLIVALVEAYARQYGIDPDDLWSYVDRRKSPPAELRDAIVAAFFPRVPPDSFLTGSREEISTISTMRTNEIEPPRRGRPSVVDHPLFAALAAKGVTLAEEAKAVKRSPASIRSMCYGKNDDNRRPAPEALQKRWLDKYGVPLKAWR